MTPGLNLYLPLVYDKQDGPYKTTKTLKQAVAQNLRLLFLTNPGERIMDLYFGIGIRKFLFENISTDTISRLKERIRTQILKYLPYITIFGISVTQPKDNYLHVKMDYSIQGISEKSFFELQTGI